MKMVKSALYCPNCGHRGIWQDEHDAGDYYAGTPMWCFACQRELPDMSVIRDPADSRQGVQGVAYSMKRYELVRDAALAVEKAAQEALEAGIKKLRAFVEQIAIDEGFRVLDIATIGDGTEWYLTLRSLPANGWQRLRLDNELAAMLDDKNRPATTELVKTELRNVRARLENW